MAWKYKPISERTALGSLLALGLLTRLPYLSWFRAETTDGIMCLEYFLRRWYDVPRFVIFPGYPLLLNLVDTESWGRLLSSLFAVGTAWPLWRMARRLVPVESAFLGCAAFLLSPLSWLWSLRVMPDTMFLFFMWTALERLQAVWETPHDNRAAVTAFLASFAALVTRPEGVFLVFATVMLLARNRKTAWAILAAVSPAILMFLPGTGSIARHVFEAFREGGVGVADPVSHFLGSFWVYTTQPTWVLTPIPVFLAIGGFMRIVAQTDDAARFWRRLTLPLLGTLLLLKMVPTNYQDRHLLPFLPAVCALFAVQMESLREYWFRKYGDPGSVMRVNLLAAAALTYLAVFSLACLAVQRDSFGDFRRNAEFLASVPASTRVFTDEMIKTAHWSGRAVQPWDPAMQTLRAGDLLVFHTFSTPRLRWLEDTLYDNHRLELVRTDESSVLPLLTDVMEDPSLQNRPRAASHRFETQAFQTRTYRVIRAYVKPRPGRPGGAT